MRQSSASRRTSKIMPPLRPLPRRRSARLQALDKPSQRSRRSQRTIDKMQGPVTRGRDSKNSHTEGDCPSGKDKVSICAVIAKYVFENDDDYADYYKAAPENF
ncbi:hypothetical protein F4604DRAFT_1692853 [Suillus subluteus]|nr:hypothetical protein F4604DRAFT_1692853 [Suillus subluteus]